MLLVTASEMRRLDELTIQQGTPGYTLMERAAEGATAALLESFPFVRRKRVVIVVGKGNNGGDGCVMARLLARRGVRPTVVLLASPRELKGDAARALTALRRAKISVVSIQKLDELAKLTPLLAASAVVVDAIFGTGLKTAVTGLQAAAIEMINLCGIPVFAVDIPSGLDADRGVPLGTAVQAEVTATFGFAKLGQCLYPGADYTGALAVVDIGITPQALAQVEPQHQWIDAGLAAGLVEERAVDSHKGTYGHVLVVAGSRGHTGAALLASRAAARTGSGLVTVAGPASLNAIFCSGAPEVMTQPLADHDGLIAFDAGALAAAVLGKSAVAVGPGLGTHAEAQQVVETLLRTTCVPLLIDADGLTCVARDVAVLRAAQAPVVLTPHPGEMARLVGVDNAAIQEDRVGQARRFATTHAVVVVLKGARTVIAAPDGRVWINSSGNPGMATGGMGDALTGIITSLLGQGLDAVDAACLGVYVHGDAGDAVAQRHGPVGILASDVIEEIPAAFARLVEVRVEISRADS